MKSKQLQTTRIGSIYMIYNKIYVPIDPSLLTIVCQGVLNITIKQVLLH